ncbi:MAG: 1,4-alpha-glucan branching protein GlgB [Myxococcales bacterium]|nr:1,4-alpha-glucan branching protein GlgB [Myxococcales bacterium]
MSRLSEQDLYLFNEGTHVRLYDKLGAHPGVVDGSEGVHFAVWAPNASEVSVIGDFNAWKVEANPLAPRASSGIFEAFVPGVALGARYKYQVTSHLGGPPVDKADPVAFHAEVAPGTASLVSSLDYAWGDAEWMTSRARRNALGAPMAIYELHVGSWRRAAEGHGRLLGYRELAPLLVDYVCSMGFTHVELLPVMEHPFYGSWGYQTTGYFAPTSRYGAPQDFMYLIDLLHQNEIGVILDWVPSHFVTDEHGLGRFDGTHLYEHGDPRQGFHPDWNSYIFNYGRHEVRSFLLSSAMYWLEKYHVDGIRVDAVASMLYLDYSRKEGEWIPNKYGGRENLDAIEFLRSLNVHIYENHPDVQTFAEESTAWPMVSRPAYVGGLGFGMKWDMGWMHDTLQYVSHEPVHRKHHHREITFRAIYAFNENFVLPLSHDEVVHGKGSLLSRMPGDDWQKFANLRLLFGYQYTQPGKKLLFMGAELAQWREWSHESTLEWHLLEYERHRGVQRWVRDLNTCYRGTPALHELDCEPKGFAWIDCNDDEQSTLTFIRRARSEEANVVVACNFTPVPRNNFRIGVPCSGRWAEILNSDATLYGGSGQGNLGGVRTTPVAWHGYPCSFVATLPPLAIVLFAYEGG